MSLPKITRDKVLALMHWCRTNKVRYQRANGYSSAVDIARRNQTRTHNNILYYAPEKKPGPHFTYAPADLQRAYIIWEGQDVDDVKDAVAWLIMATGRSDILVLRANGASQAAIMEEDVTIMQMAS